MIEGMCPRGRKASLAIALFAMLSPMAHAQTDDIAAIVARSDIAIGQPNVLPMQALGLGNGPLRAAFWAADGFTLQLNRADTLPYRRSPGQVIFPDLKALTADRGFSGHVDLYDGAIDETGGGITLHAWVDRDVDRVIVDIAGLPVDKPQRVVLRLWEPRTPVASIQNEFALLSETWRDDQLPGNSGRVFGSLAAIQATSRHLVSTASARRQMSHTQRSHARSTSPAAQRGGTRSGHAPI